MYTHQAYLIETSSHTHVGSGQETYGIADKEIQRDPVTSVPVFHGSSIKGALRSHLEPFMDDDLDFLEASRRVKRPSWLTIFGGEEAANLKALANQLNEEAKEGLISPEKSAGNDQLLALLQRAPKHGLVKFYEGRLLFIPLRSTARVFHYGTSPAVLLDYLDHLKSFDSIDGDDYDFLSSWVRELGETLEKGGKDFLVSDAEQDHMEVEDYSEFGSFLKSGDSGQKEKLASLFDIYFPSSIQGVDFLDSLAVFSDNGLSDICRLGLPVIARNAIGLDGTSENLFYEEVLPRRSILWFATGTYRLLGDNRKEKTSFEMIVKKFEERMTGDIIQFGANASIGYGDSIISQVKGSKGVNHE